MTVPAVHCEARVAILTPFNPPPADAEWRLVTYAPDYEVSEFGHVRRRTRGRAGQAVVGLVLRPRLTEGYPRYGLWIAGAPRYFTAHRLVADAFIGVGGPGKQIAHRDGNRLHAHFQNLRWATSAENSEDRDAHGRTSRGASHSAAVMPNRPRGEKVNGARLLPDDVREIRASAENGPTLAKRYGVARHTINSIRRGETWKHIQ